MTNEGAPSGMGQTDRDLVALFAVQSASLKAGLATLARIGVRWRKAEPDRCRSWITTLETHPFYKAGQTLYDLLELEDFILDEGDTIDADALADVLGRIASLLGLPISAFRVPEDLPDLEMGFYLYRDTVLGFVSILLEPENVSRFTAAMRDDQ